jgi:hypothetical protein
MTEKPCPKQTEQWVDFALKFRGMNWYAFKRHACSLNLVFAQDFVKSLKKITAFLGIDVNDSEMAKIARSTSFSEMKSNAAKENCDPNHVICALTSDRNLVFRKGLWIKVCGRGGGWVAGQEGAAAKAFAADRLALGF